MYDIFISYRRRGFSRWGRWFPRWRPGDNAQACLVRDALKEKYSVFLDSTSIAVGERFPEQIETALRECRVFIAVIGPHWSCTEWIRREIREVLSRDPKSVRIVPVVMDGTPFPPAGTVPEGLGPFFKIQAQEVTDYDRDLPALLETVGRLLDGEMAPERKGPAHLPYILPYLCDRSNQHEDLLEKLSDSKGRNPVIVLHGHEKEEHDGFLDRVRWSKDLARILNAEAVGVAECVVDWNVEKAKRGEYLSALRAALKRQSMGVGTATDDELNQHLETLAKPLLVTLRMPWDYYVACRKGAIQGFVKAWDSLFEGLSRPAQPVILWINVTYNDFEQQLAPADLKSSAALPLLKGVQEVDIYNWINDRTVRRILCDKEPIKEQVANLRYDDTLYVKGHGMHMRTFAEAVKRILASC